MTGKRGADTGTEPDAAKIAISPIGAKKGDIAIIDNRRRASL